MKFFVLIILAVLVYFFVNRAKSIGSVENQSLETERMQALEEQQVTLSDEELKSHFKKLVDLLLHNGDPETLKAKIDALQLDEISNEYYEDHFHNLGMALNEYNYKPNDHIPGVTFVAPIDWKEAIEDFVWKMNSALGGKEILDLPRVEDYPANASVGLEGVFKDYSVALLKANIVKRHIENGSDTHLVIFHDKEKSDEVVAVLKAMAIESYVFE